MARESPGPCLVQPGGEEPFDVAAAARRLEPPRHCLALDDDQRRHRLDPEVLEEIRTLFLGHADDLERPVVAATLENLREEPLDTPTMAGQCRMEEDEAGLPQG